MTWRSPTRAPSYKYFYLYWNIDIWCCEAWHLLLGLVFDLDAFPTNTNRAMPVLWPATALPACSYTRLSPP